MNKTQMSIRNSGMGSFLNPDGDAEHYYHVADSQGSMSLRAAMDCNWLHDDTKQKVQRLLDENPPRFTDDWELAVHQYMQFCYSPDGVNRNASDCVIDRSKKTDPKLSLAFLYIRKFFPNYEPNMDYLAHDGD